MHCHSYNSVYTLQTITWLYCSYTMLLFVQLTDRGSKYIQSHAKIVPTLCSYSSNLHTRNRDLANHMIILFLHYALIRRDLGDLDPANHLVVLFLNYALIHQIYRQGIQIYPIMCQCSDLESNACYFERKFTQT